MEPSVPYERLVIDSDLSITSLDWALRQMGNPEGPCCVHVCPQWVATDRAWLDTFVEEWSANSPTGNALQVVGDHDIKRMHEWYVECRGRRVGSPAP
jgi:hypothetical protein